MKLTSITAFLLTAGIFSAQVTIEKTTNAAAPANTSVSLELGNPTGGTKGIVLPWVNSAATVATPVAGTLIFDSNDKKVKYLKNGSAWVDLSIGSKTPPVAVGKPDDNAESANAKVVIGADGATNTTSGILVLSDAAKAMVLPRVNSFADIVNPSPGMMVYTTSNNQLAVFNGQEWSFWKGPTSAVLSSTGRIWMDRNLGANQVSTSSTDAASYGDLYQWGRLSDAHQFRNSPTTTTKSTTDTPGNNNFVVGDFFWRNPTNPNLWQGVNGINNPCPAGYRLPTIAEFQDEAASWATGNRNIAGAFASPLKFSATGLRKNMAEGGTAGDKKEVGTVGYYWTSTINGNDSRYFRISDGQAENVSGQRASGAAVRCIRD